MREEKEETNNVLECLFPDNTVRKIISRVDGISRTARPGLYTSYSGVDDGGTTIFSVTGEACFSNLGMHVTRGWNKGLKYLLYYPEYCKRRATTGVAAFDDLPLPEKTQLRWLELGQEIGLLEDLQHPKDILKNKLQVNIRDPELSPARLYMQLSYVRWLREAPKMVESVIELVDAAGRDFWAAVVYSHYRHVHYMDQSLIPCAGINRVRGYSVGIERDLGLVIRLHQLTNSPTAWDARRVVENAEKRTWPRWNWHNELVKPLKNFVLKDRHALLSSEVFPIVACGDWNKAASLAEELRKKGTYVKFDTPHPYCKRPQPNIREAIRVLGAARDAQPQASGN